MSPLDLIGTAVSSILSGGATGLIGVVIQRYFDLQKGQLDLALAKQQQEHELSMRAKDAEIMQLEYAGKTQVAQVEGQTQEAVSANQAFAASLLKEPERYSDSSRLTPVQMWMMVLLDTARGIVRPLLTLYLCALVTYIWWQVKILLSHEDLAGSDVLPIWRLVVETILYLWTTVTLWWFGTRNKQAAPSLRGLSSGAGKG